MSKVLDQDKNIVNAPAPQTTDGRGKSRYSSDGLTLDWFDTHPRADVKKIVVTDGVPACVSDPETSAKIDEIAKNLGDATKTDAALTEAANPPYEDENGKRWLYNPATEKWDIPEATDEIAPSNSDGASV